MRAPRAVVPGVTAWRAAVTPGRARRLEAAERQAAELLTTLTPRARRRVLAAVAVWLGHDALARELLEGAA